MVRVIESDLNDNDKKLLAYCMNQDLSIGNLSKLLNISPASVSVKVKKLEKQGLVTVHKSKPNAKKTLVRTKKGIKTGEYILKILNEIKESGNSVSIKEYIELPKKIDLNEMISHKNDIFTASNILLYDSPYIEQRIILTEQGKRFLEEKKK